MMTASKKKRETDWVAVDLKMKREAEVQRFRDQAYLASCAARDGELDDAEEYLINALVTLRAAKAAKAAENAHKAGT